MPYTLIVGIVGSIILVIGAAWPENKSLGHPIKSVKNWLFTIGGLFLLVYAILGFLEGGPIFFVFLEILILIASILMMSNTDDRIDVILISIASLFLIGWSLTLFEGYSTLIFIAGLAGLGFGYAFKMGTLRRSLSLATGSLLVAIFSYMEASWIFFWLNMFFMAFSSYYLLITLSYQKALIISAAKNPYKTTLNNFQKVKIIEPKTVSFNDIKNKENIKSTYRLILQKNNELILFNKLLNNEPLPQKDLNALDANRIELNSLLYKIKNIYKFLSPDVMEQLSKINPKIIELLSKDNENKFEDGLKRLYALDLDKFNDIFNSLKIVHENENKINIINNIILETCSRYDIDLDDLNCALLIDDNFKRDKTIERLVKRVSIFGRLKWSTQKGLKEFENIINRLDKRQELENIIMKQNSDIQYLSNLLKVIIK